MLALLFRIDSLLKRFQEYPDKFCFCGITTAMLAGTWQIHSRFINILWTFKTEICIFAFMWGNRWRGLSFLSPVNLTKTKRLLKNQSNVLLYWKMYSTAAKSASMTLSTDMTWITTCQSSLHLRVEWAWPKNSIMARTILHRSILIPRAKLRHVFANLCEAASAAKNYLYLTK